MFPAYIHGDHSPLHPPSCLLGNLFGAPDNQYQHQNCEQDIMILYDI